jgi:3-demethoxyubiquinol 3-hydroxylase
MHSPRAAATSAGQRRLSALDRLLVAADTALRAATGADAPAPERPSPADAAAEGLLDDDARALAARLMRVNHAGEVAAQALYDGQAATARTPALRRALRRAAREERDHLAWCEARVRELGSAPSALAALWYGGSWAIGALAGLGGDRRSLGFVAETERQVVEHLERHLERLPEEDARSRAVLEQMRADEARHGADARRAGGEELPGPVRALMRLTSRVMTGTAYWI